MIGLNLAQPIATTPLYNLGSSFSFGHLDEGVFGPSISDGRIFDSFQPVDKTFSTLTIEGRQTRKLRRANGLSCVGIRHGWWSKIFVGANELLFVRVAAGILWIRWR